MSKLKSLITSRRFWAMIAGSVWTIVAKELGIDESVILAVDGMIATWILGDSMNKTA